MLFVCSQTQDPECLFSFHSGAIEGLAVSPLTYLMATTALDCKHELLPIPLCACYTFMHVHVCVYMFWCMCFYACIYIYMCSDICLHVLCMHACLSICTCVLVCVCVCGSQRVTSGVFLYCFLPYVLRWSLTKPWVHQMVRLSSQEAPGILLSLHPQLWGYRHVPPCLSFS